MRRLHAIVSDRSGHYCGRTVVGSEVSLSNIVPYGTVALYAEVSPDSKPSKKSSAEQLVRISRPEPLSAT